VREPNLIAIGGPYQIQAINSVDWWYSQPENEGQVLCTLASDDEYGDTGVEGAEFAAENLGIEVAVRAEFPAPSATRAAQTFESQLSQLESGGCEVIVFVALPSDTAPLNTVLEENTGYNPTIFGQSPTWLGLFANFGYLQENYFLAVRGHRVRRRVGGGHGRVDAHPGDLRPRPGPRPVLQLRVFAGHGHGPDPRRGGEPGAICPARASWTPWRTSTP
jgi:hypothetical protein